MSLQNSDHNSQLQVTQRRRPITHQCSGNDLLYFSSARLSTAETTRQTRSLEKLSREIHANEQAEVPPLKTGNNVSTRHAWTMKKMLFCCWN